MRAIHSSKLMRELPFSSVWAEDHAMEESEAPSITLSHVKLLI